jgi:DsbC/DsbD-like thiol-disulfide interchange protein
MHVPRAALLAIAAFSLASGPIWGAAGEWSTNPQSSVRLITPWQVAPRSGELILGLQFKLAPGWHVYWKNSGDAGFPPSATFGPAGVLAEGAILWPTPHRFELPGNLVAFGYEKEVVYPARVTIHLGALLPTPAAPATSDTPAEASPIETNQDSLHITADLDYLVCEVDCIPYRYTLAVDQSLDGEPAPDPETAPLIQTWLDQVPSTVADAPGVRTGAVLDASRAGETPQLEIRVLGARAQAGKTDVFLEPHDLLDAGKPRIKATADGVVFHLPMKPREAGKPLPERTTLAWTISNLQTPDGKPLNLEAKRDVQVWTQAGAAPPDPLKAGPAKAGPDRLPRLLLWALLGGVLLNLTPTVLALLIPELLALRGGEGSLREAAAAVASGIVGASWGIAGLSLLAQGRGLPAGWGAQLQDPALGTLLAVGSAVLALNLWGLVEIPLAPAGARAGTGRHLLAGLFTAPLALAWPLPVLQEPLGYAFSRSPAAVCAVFAVIGFGLALPYLLLTLAPGLLRRLPAPGAWLERLREGLGFLAGASTLWLLYALSRQVSAEGLAFIELALLGMGLLAWLRSRPGSRAAARLVFAVGVLACAATALWLADHNRLEPRSPLTRSNPIANLNSTGG